MRDVAEKVRLVVEQTTFRFEKHVMPTTISCGATVWLKGEDGAEALYKRADAALYRAKQGGRNRVETGLKSEPTTMRLAGAPTRHVVTFSLLGCAFGWLLPAQAQQPMPMQAGGLAPPPPMQTGGLAPPPPGSGPPPPPPPMYPGATQRQLEEASREDSGRGLEFVYFDVGGGGQLAALTAHLAERHARSGQ